MQDFKLSPFMSTSNLFDDITATGNDLPLPSLPQQPSPSQYLTYPHHLQQQQQQTITRRCSLGSQPVYRNQPASPSATYLPYNQSFGSFSYLPALGSSGGINNSVFGSNSSSQTLFADNNDQQYPQHNISRNSSSKNLTEFLVSNLNSQNTQSQSQNLNARSLAVGQCLLFFSHNFGDLIASALS